MEEMVGGGRSITKQCESTGRLKAKLCSFCSSDGGLSWVLSVHPALHSGVNTREIEIIRPALSAFFFCFVSVPVIKNLGPVPY